MLLLLASGCVPAAVYGMRFDGGMAEVTELAAVGGVFPGSTSEEFVLADTAVMGLQARQRIGENATLSMAAGAALGTLADNAAGAGEVEVQWRVLDDAPVTLSLLGGIDGFVQAEGDSIMLGVHAGAVLSRDVGARVRPYVGVKINPILNVGDELFPWLQYGGGLSWRPRLAPATRGLFAVEASGYRGFGADLVNDQDLVTWGVMASVGASFGNDDRDSER
jgi:hypothetical protein